MRKPKVLIGIFLLAIFVLSACSGQPANDVMNDMDAMENKGDEMMDKDADHSDDGMNDSMENKDDEMMEDKDDDMAEEGSDSAMMGPKWHAYQLTNVSTGETFSIGQFKGKVLLVENMATWCSNCLKQQQQVKEFHQLLGTRDDFMSIGLSLEAEMDPGQLTGYINDKGFDWTYAIAPNEVQEGIVETLGGQFLNPPATPIFIVDKEGNVHPLPLGKIKSADELLAFVEPFL